MENRTPETPQAGDKPKKKPDTAGKKAGKPAPRKPSFDFNSLMDIEKIKEIASNMSETQWGILAGAVFILGYVLYEFVLMAPASSVNTMAPVMVPRQEESAEERFRRENSDIRLPDGSAISPEVIAEKTQVTRQIPFGDRELEFQVRLPKHWFMSEFARYGLPGEDNYSVLTNIARYFGPSIIDTRPYLWVEVQRLQRYMTAEAWTRAYMIKRGISPQAFEVVSPTEIQALYVDVRDFQSYAVRSLFQIEGDTMVLVSFGVPVDSYNDYKDIMAVTLKSFELIRPIRRTIEAINHYDLMKVLAFDHYASWLARNPVEDSTLSPSVELHNPQEGFGDKSTRLQGLILINAWRKSPQFPPERNLQEIHNRLSRMNMMIREESAESVDIDTGKRFIDSVRTKYLAQVDAYVQRDQFDIVKSEKSMTSQEVWITALDNDYYRVYLTLISPLKETNYVVWAQNQAAYDLLLETIRVRGRSEE